jgi:Uma2 family endonuclease
MAITFSSMFLPGQTSRPIIYPDSDGQPMADNTLQWEWIATIKNGLEDLFRDRADVFIAGDLLWYPVEGDPKIRAAPDAMVVFGRPKGYRGSYRQWEEEGIAPQVVFEVLSPGNTGPEMLRKFRFYEQHNVLEYYVYDPGDPDNAKHPTSLAGWHRAEVGQPLKEITPMAGWRSPRLGINFRFNPTDGLTLLHPDGRPFETYVELSKRAEQEGRRAEQEHLRAERLAQRTARLEAQLRAAGIDPANGDADTDENTAG